MKNNLLAPACPAQDDSNKWQITPYVSQLAHSNHRRVAMSITYTEWGTIKSVGRLKNVRTIVHEIHEKHEKNATEH